MSSSCTGSRQVVLLGVLRAGSEVCVSVTIFDGLVLARSAFEHSMNYRSVVIFGRARWLRDDKEKFVALRALAETPASRPVGRRAFASEAELRQTHVFAVPLPGGLRKGSFRAPIARARSGRRGPGSCRHSMAGNHAPRGRSRWGPAPDYLVNVRRPRNETQSRDEAGRRDSVARGSANWPGSGTALPARLTQDARGADVWRFIARVDVR